MPMLISTDLRRIPLGQKKQSKARLKLAIARDSIKMRCFRNDSLLFTEGGFLKLVVILSIFKR